MTQLTHNRTATCYGEVLWDILPDGQQPGGAPLNVAYHLNKLGVHVNLVSRIGDDQLGCQITELIRQWGIGVEFLQVDPCHATSRVLAKMNDGNEVSYDIVFPVAWDYISYSQRVKAQLNPSGYLIYGSLSSRNAESQHTLLQLLESDAIKVFDINLRPPFINRDLLSSLLSKADIVKFNQSELEMAQSHFGGSFGSEASQVEFIQQRFGVSEVIVTKGEFGASYYIGDRAYRAWGSEVEVMDTIGSGDSFLAAFIANHAVDSPPQTIIDNAVAMGAFVATKKGGCPDYHFSDYLNFKTNNFLNLKIQK
jgi:fructokinase